MYQQFILFTIIIGIFDFIIMDPIDTIDIDSQKVSYKQVKKGYKRWKQKKNSNVLLIPENTLYCASAKELKKAQVHRSINVSVDSSYLFRINCFGMY